MTKFYQISEKHFDWTPPQPVLGEETFFKTSNRKKGRSLKLWKFIAEQKSNVRMMMECFYGWITKKDEHNR